MKHKAIFDFTTSEKVWAKNAINEHSFVVVKSFSENYYHRLSRVSVEFSWLCKKLTLECLNSNELLTSMSLLSLFGQVVQKMLVFLEAPSVWET